MKIHSVKELTKMAQEVFKSNPEAKKVLATTDGNIFLEAGENAATLHSRSNNNLTVHTIHRDGKTEENEDPNKGLGLEIILPAKNATVPEIKDWMKAQEIEFDEKDTKAILSEKIQNHLAELAEKQKAAEPPIQ